VNSNKTAIAGRLCAFKAKYSDQQKKVAAQPLDMIAPLAGTLKALGYRCRDTSQPGSDELRRNEETHCRKASAQRAAKWQAAVIELCTRRTSAPTVAQSSL
jgi:hypothetical protein